MNQNVAIDIGVTAIIVVVIGAFAFAYGILAGVFPDGKDFQLTAVTVPFAELARGADAPIDRRVNYLIASMEQFRDLWAMIGATGPMPDIDFSEYVVAAVFAGVKPTGGYDIAVSGVTDADVRTVTVTLTEPGGDCILTQALTTPYQIVKLPRTALNLIHEDVSTTVGCSE